MVAVVVVIAVVAVVVAVVVTGGGGAHVYGLGRCGSAISFDSTDFGPHTIPVGATVYVVGATPRLKRNCTPVALAA